MVLTRLSRITVEFLALHLLKPLSHDAEPLLTYTPLVTLTLCPQPPLKSILGIFPASCQSWTYPGPMKPESLGLGFELQNFFQASQRFQYTLQFTPLSIQNDCI